MWLTIGFGSYRSRKIDSFVRQPLFSIGSTYRSDLTHQNRHLRRKLLGNELEHLLTIAEDAVFECPEYILRAFVNGRGTDCQ